MDRFGHLFPFDMDALAADLDAVRSRPLRPFGPLPWGLAALPPGPSGHLPRRRFAPGGGNGAGYRSRTDDLLITNLIRGVEPTWTYGPK